MRKISEYLAKIKLGNFFLGENGFIKKIILFFEKDIFNNVIGSFLKYVFYEFLPNIIIKILDFIFIKIKKAVFVFLNSRKLQIAIAIFLTVSVLFGLFSRWFLFERSGAYFAIPDYSAVSILTLDEISQSADLLVRVPKDFHIINFKKSAKVGPFIFGRWTDEGGNVFKFSPYWDFKVGRHYTITLETDKGIIGKDFFVEEDPRVISVLPNPEKMEADENSKITINFNRAMVPLGVWNEMHQDEVPVEINPETEGAFKWIGSKTLQFIPKEGLLPASKYVITVKNDFTSLDEVHIDSFRHEFITRLIRNNFVTTNKLPFNQPIHFVFNQAVNLDELKDDLTVYNTTDNKNIDLIVEYGSNESEVLVYQKQDKFGRERNWDFNKNYAITVDEFIPKRGKIKNDDGLSSQFFVPGIVEKIHTESEHLGESDLSFFDPQGIYWINFYEDVDLEKSNFDIPGLKERGYGQKCKLENKNTDDYYYDKVCEKVDDKKSIYFKFNKDGFERGKEYVLKFLSVYNMDGILINAESIESKVIVIPNLEVRSAGNSENDYNGTTTLTLCSSLPLNKESISVKADKQFNQKNIYAYNNFYGVTKYKTCNPKEFKTTINYNALPETDYNFKIALEDLISGRKNLEVNFKTGKIKRQNLNFLHYQPGFKYNVTTPDRTKLTYSLENMNFVDMKICEVDIETMLDLVHDDNLVYGDASILGGKCHNEHTDHIQVDEGVYWKPKYFQVDLKKYYSNIKGHYVLFFSNPDYTFDSNAEQIIYEKTLISVTDLGVVQKYMKPNAEMRDIDKTGMQGLTWVFNMNDLSPVKDAVVELYSGVAPLDSDKYSNYRNKFSEKEKKADLRTNGKGLVTTDPVLNYAGSIIKKGNDATLAGIYDTTIDYASDASTLQRAYIYADRPIYRPGQEVFIKGIIRSGYDGEFILDQGTKVKMEIKDSVNNILESKEVEINDFGNVSASFMIPEDANLGDYTVNLPQYNGMVTFDVEDYEPAPFKVDVNFSKEEYLNGENFEMDIDAEYYFGAKVKKGEIEYSIVSQDYHFDKYKDDYFSFGNEWYYCYYDCSYNDRFIMKNTVPLSADGKTKVSQEIDLEKWIKATQGDGSKVKSSIITVYAKVTNENGQSVTSVKSFIAHKGEYYLGVKTDKYFGAAGQDFSIKVKSVDVNGNNRKVDSLKLTIGKWMWNNNKRREVDGGYYYNSTREFVEVHSENVSTDNAGNWAGSYNFPEIGSYEIIISGKDSRGIEIDDSYSIYVYGGGIDQVRMHNNTQLEVMTQKSDLKVSEKGRILFESPFKKAKALVSVERGKIYDYDIIDVDQTYNEYKFEVRDNYVPNVFVGVTLISDYPEIKYGQYEFTINRETHELNIETKSSKLRYLPGEQVDLDIIAKDFQGRPVEAEISVAVADLSVLALKGNPKKNPIIFFYSGFPLTVTTNSNLKNILFEMDVPSDTKGGGGMEPEDLAKRKRGEFKDTAFWNANVRTDANGRAHISFKLPDNLTTWQIESVGVTKDTHLGVDYYEFKANKELMVTSIAPRFVVPGDKFSLVVNVFNQSDQKQTIDVSAVSLTLPFGENSAQKIELAAGDQQTIFFEVNAPKEQTKGRHLYTLSAIAPDYEDVVEHTIKVLPKTTYEAVATGGILKNESKTEFVQFGDNILPDEGGVVVNHSATLAVFLEDALQYLVDYPYGCSEQIASKLIGIARVKKAFNVPNIEEITHIKDIEYGGKYYTIDELVNVGLTELYKNQSAAGGFGYWKPEIIDLSLTVYVAGVLGELKEAGYDIPDDVIQRASNYISNNVVDYSKRYDNKDILIHAVRSMRDEDLAINKGIINEIGKLVANESYLYDEKSNNQALSQLAVVVFENKDIFGKRTANKVLKALENRIVVDSRGAFLPTNEKNRNWRYYETPINNTALAITAFSKAQSDYPYLDEMIRWTLKSRDKDGVWDTTNTTANVIEAFSAYLVWMGETKSDFVAQMFLNGELENEFEYNKETILTQNQSEIAMSKLPVNQLNQITIKKENISRKNSTLYYDMQFKYFLPFEQIGARDEGFVISREYFRLDDKENKFPVNDAKIGEVLKGKIEIIVPQNRRFVAVENFLPAGLELINTDLATEFLGFTDNGVSIEKNKVHRSYKFNPVQEELRDDRLFLYVQDIKPGVYEYEFFVRARVPGEYQQLPAVASEMYFPENYGRTGASYFRVVK